MSAVVSAAAASTAWWTARLKLHATFGSLTGPAVAARAAASCSTPTVTRIFTGGYGPESTPGSRTTVYSPSASGSTSPGSTSSGSTSSDSSDSSGWPKVSGQGSGSGRVPAWSGRGMPARAAPRARQSVRASRFRCPRSRVSGSTRSTPCGSIARPGRGALPAASTARIRAPWVAAQANLPTRFPFASGEAYRNLRSCAPAGVFGFNSSTSARANRSSSRTPHARDFSASSASTASIRRTHPPSPSTGISSSRILSPRSRWARTATSTCPRSTVPAA